MKRVGTGSNGQVDFGALRITLRKASVVIKLNESNEMLSGLLLLNLEESTGGNFLQIFSIFETKKHTNSLAKASFDVVSGKNVDLR